MELDALIEIRRVTEANPDIFDRVAEDVFDAPIDPAHLAAYLREPGHLMVVALNGGTVIGQTAAVIHRHPDKPTELYIDEVGVTPAFQRQGIARKILDMMFALGRDLACEEAWVGTEIDNVPARRLYEARGAEAETFVMYVYDLSE